MTPNDRFRLMKAHVVRIHEAVCRNLVLPDGLPADARCRIEIVQKPSGALEATEIVECYPKVFESVVLSAIVRTSLPAPLQFPDDPPVARNTTILEFSNEDLKKSD